MNKKIAILGFGQEGKAILKFLFQNKIYKNAEITVCDKNEKISGLPGRKSINFQLGKNYLKNLEKFDVIFRSPGIPYNLPEIQKALKTGVKISSGTVLFSEQAKKIGCRVIGVTGTKGKGTVATLLFKILKRCDRDVYLAGNIGKPALEIIPHLKKNTLVILELSSFQLQDLEFSPEIAVVLEIFPDHLDAHKNFREYLKAKANIAKWQKKNDKIFYFSENKYTHWIAAKSPAKKFLVKMAGKIFKENNLKIPGAHNLKNALMAYKIAATLGASKSIALKTIKNFKGNKHRLELVRKIHDISFYNDSASTNPQTATAAIKSFAEPKILIAGGKDKNLDYAPLAQTLKNSNTKMVALYGENKNKIKRQLEISNLELEIKICRDLKSVVDLAYKKAELLVTNYKLPITIIFSPAAASFDMFKDYKERGKKFKEIVEHLK